MEIKERLRQHQANGENRNTVTELLEINRITAANATEAVKKISRGKLHAFEGHTFKVETSSPDYKALEAAIRDHGIQQPLIVRPHTKIPGDYEIISGHRRSHIAEALEIEELPCIVQQMDDDTAIQIMAVSNVQRPDWLPSEKARTYKAHLEATQRQTGISHGARTDLTSANRLPKLRNRDMAAEVWHISGQMFDMYIKLNELDEQLLEMTDERRIAVSGAYKLSFLRKDEQELLARILTEHPKVKISHPVGNNLREAGKRDKLTEDVMLEILGVTRKKADNTIAPKVKIEYQPSEPLDSKELKLAFNDAEFVAEFEKIFKDWRDHHAT